MKIYDFYCIRKLQLKLKLDIGEAYQDLIFLKIDKEG